MYTISLYLFIALMVAAVGAVLFLGSVVVVLLQMGSQAIAREMQRHARSAANVQLQPQEPAAQTRLRA